MSTPNEQVMQAKLYGLKAEAERWEKAYRVQWKDNQDLMGRIAQLETENQMLLEDARLVRAELVKLCRTRKLEEEGGIPARCPDCGEYVEFHHYSAGYGGCIVECIENDCGYATDEASSWEEAWSKHQANVDAMQ